MESILTTIKKQIGIDESDPFFDSQIIVGINMAISVLNQIGIGPLNGFMLINGAETWNDYIPDLETSPRFIHVQSYIYCQTKLFFDPPANQTMLKYLQDKSIELEWRLKVESEKS